MVLLSRPSEWRYLEGSCGEVVHTWTPSCLVAAVELTLVTTYEGVKIYLPLYLIAELLGRRSLSSVARVVPQVLRSSLFLASNLGLSVAFICLFRRLIGRFYLYTTAFLPAVLSTGMSLLIEKKGRRPALAGYCAVVSLEQLYNILKHYKVLKGLPYGEVLIFSMATAVLFHRYRTEVGRGNIVSLILKTLLTPKLPRLITSPLQHTVLDNRLTHILLVGAWAFVLGYCIQLLISLISDGTQLLKGKGKWKKFVADSRKVKFAAFLSSLAAGYKLVNSVLYYLPLPRDLRLLLAGLVAGLSLLFYRSTSVALYVGWKALEVVYAKGVELGWLRYLPHGEVLIYALGTASLGHGWFFESHNMRRGYWHFLRTITRGRMLKVNFAALDVFGTGSSTQSQIWHRKQGQQKQVHPTS